MNGHRAPRVLVIDDEVHVRGLLCDLLSFWGYEAHAATSGREGLALFRGGGFDLVLTDLVMPGVTGLEVAETVRESDPSVEVIMLTGSGADLQHHGRRLGFTLLRKPLEVQGLETAVKQALLGRAAADRERACD